MRINGQRDELALARKKYNVVEGADALSSAPNGAVACADFDEMESLVVGKSSCTGEPLQPRAPKHRRLALLQQRARAGVWESMGSDSIIRDESIECDPIDSEVSPHSSDKKIAKSGSAPPAGGIDQAVESPHDEEGGEAGEQRWGQGMRGRPTEDQAENRRYAQQRERHQPNQPCST